MHEYIIQSGVLHRERLHCNASLDGHLDQTLVCVISKSGGTKETRNGMLEAQAAYDRFAAGGKLGKIVLEMAAG